ncbi:hypothetical protein, variant [Verruconis gallopava]|uniref:Uncharacterized protein n=1 Tax=Verruconis gallopava TaxID=253628 RepID=A0A0D1ZVW2_9PEZI|nr:hypothetical protein, variant [Verruconis gallopava]KIV98592.1 hypothetical protein, variant [Verruconis gallopava]
MTTAVAALPATAPLAPPATVMEQSSSANKSFASIAASTAGNTSTPQRTASSKSTNSHSPPTRHEPQLRRTTSDGKRSPQSASSNRQIPKVVVKKEPTSPDLPTSRHRPTRLNLASSNMTNGAAAPAGALSARPSAGPLTSRDSAGLHLHDIGVACLSPGFNTQDPTMREQMERAMNIREQQRRLIEDRQKGKTGAANGPGDSENAFGRPTKTPATSRRKGPPPGLSIAAPPAEAFANERVIQSAPLHASFPRHNMHASSRDGINGSSRLVNMHAPANQTSNRLPPIADVFPEVQQQSSTGRGPHYQSPGSSSQNQPPLPSPSYPPHTAQFPPTGLVSRPREHKSAEEALKELTGGREDLLPRLVHYGGHQPPTPPSPKNVGLGVSNSGPHTDLHRSGSSRRRDRDEYERDNGTPPLGRGPTATRRSAPFGEGRDSPRSTLQKKEEFLSLVSRAWDLWHS